MKFHLGANISLIFLICFTNCNVKELECEDGKSTKYLSAELLSTHIMLHSISKHYFLSSLKTLTYHNGFYYNIDTDKKKFYQFIISSGKNDTLDVFVSLEVDLNFRPKDFYISNTTLYILSDYPNSILFKCSLPIANEHLNRFSMDSSNLQSILDRITVLPFCRLYVNDNRFVIATIEEKTSDAISNMYFQNYDLKLSKTESRFVEFPEFTNANYYPSLQIPFKIDRDTYSLVSFGFNHFISVYNNQKGVKFGEHCAKSKYIDTFQGINIDDLEDIQNHINFVIGTAYYLNLIYDQSTDYFYRIAKHSQEIKNKLTNKLNRTDHSPWSIVVLDRNLLFVDEIFIPPQTVSFLNHFTDDNGVHFLSIDTSSINKNDSILQFKTISVR